MGIFNFVYLLRMYAFIFVVYLVLLVTALLTGATSKDPRKYPQNVDKLRAVCEVLTIIGTVIYFALEIDQMVK